MALFNINKPPADANGIAGSANRDQTTKTIALTLLYTFIASVFILFVTNLFIKEIFKGGCKLPGDPNDLDFRKGWFDLLKNAMVLLGTALTTVIGYYFGQREGAIKANEAEKKAAETNQQAGAAVSDANQQRDEEIINNTKKSDPTNPERPPLDESNSNIQPPV